MVSIAVVFMYEQSLMLSDCYLKVVVSQMDVSRKHFLRFAVQSDVVGDMTEISSLCA